jgi:hypothetical protein
MRRLDWIPMVRYVLRRGPWPAIGGVALTLGAVVVWRAVEEESTDALVPWLRLTAVVFGAAVASSVEDVAVVVSSATPFGRLCRRLLGAALPCAAVVALWLTIASVSSLVVGDGQGSARGLLIEVVGLAAAGVALGAVLDRGGERGSGTRASVLTVVVVLLTLAHPRTIRWLWAPPGSGSDWSAGRTHWALVAVVAGALFVGLSLDPARRSMRRTTLPWHRIGGVA